MAHIELLEQEFPGRVLGGLVKIVATLDGDAVRQMTGLTTLTIGSLTGTAVPDQIVGALNVPGIDLTVSPDILGALWEKWAFIAAAGVITCLFRGPIGKILEAGGLPKIIEAINETETVAAKAGHPVSAQAHAQSLGLLTEAGSAFTSSLYRDLTAGLPTEAEHILGPRQAGPTTQCPRPTARPHPHPAQNRLLKALSSRCAHCSSRHICWAAGAHFCGRIHPREALPEPVSREPPAGSGP